MSSRQRLRICDVWVVAFLLASVGFSALAFAQTRPPAIADRLQSITQLADRQRWQAAAAEIASYRRLHPDSVPAAVLQAEILVHIGLLSDANTVLQRILALHPRSVEALSAFAELSRTLNDKATAEELLLRCTRYSPADPATWKRLGDFYLAAGRKEALNAFRHALALAPRDATVMAGMAAARHQQGDDFGARHDFEQANRWNETAVHPDAMVDFLFAEFLLDLSDYSESLKYYQRAFDRNPTLTQARLGRAKSLIHLQKWSLAENDLKATATADEWKIESLNLLTKVYREQGKSAEAADTAAEAEQFSSEQSAEKALGNQIASSLQNAHALEQEKKFSEAAQAYQQLTHDHPDVLAAWLGLGRCEAELGELNEAETAVRSLISRQDGSAEAHALLGKMLLRSQKSDEAREEFLRAERLDPLFTDARLGEAASYMVESRFPDAIRILQTAKTDRGAGVEVRLMLTEALYKNGQRNAALEEINDAIHHFPENKQAQAMKDSLLQSR